MSSENDKTRIKDILKSHISLGPKNVNIHLNNSCNLSCLFCYYHSPLVKRRNVREKDFDFETLKQVIYDCTEMGVETIDLESEGETFLYPKIEETIKLIKNKGMRMEAFTNGIFDNNNLDVVAMVDKLKINLSAGTKETYKKVHGRGLFNRVVKNIRFLKKNKHQKSPKIDIIYIINELNCREIEDIINLCSLMRIDRISFKLIEATNETKNLIPSNESFKKLRKEILNVLSKNYKVRTNLGEIYRMTDCISEEKERFFIKRTRMHNDRYFYFKSNFYKNNKCYIPWFSAYIDLEGRVLAPCDNASPFIAGNIRDSGLKDIWFSDRYKKIRSEALKIDLNKKRWQQCRYCTNMDFNNKINRVIKTISH